MCSNCVYLYFNGQLAHKFTNVYANEYPLRVVATLHSRNDQLSFEHQNSSLFDCNQLLEIYDLLEASFSKYEEQLTKAKHDFKSLSNEIYENCNDFSLLQDFLLYMEKWKNK